MASDNKRFGSNPAPRMKPLVYKHSKGKQNNFRLYLYSN